MGKQGSAIFFGQCVDSILLQSYVGPITSNEEQANETSNHTTRNRRSYGRSYIGRTFRPNDPGGSVMTIQRDYDLTQYLSLIHI